LGETVASSTERLVDIGDIRMNIVEAGRPGDPAVILAHGFPELAYSWRHQIPVLAEAGYHVIAPDQRGYGGTSRPPRLPDYDIHALTGDLVGLLDVLGVAQAVFIGHDWGASVVWHTALLHPHRVRAVAGLSVPLVPRARRPPTQAFAKFGADFYMLRFQEPGVADTELGADPAATMRTLFAGAADAPLPSWITAAELDHYATVFRRTGFTGGLNWYRNLDRNWADTAELAGRTVSAPALFIAGTADPYLAYLRTERVAEVMSGPYRQVFIDGAGHWIQQDSAAEVNRLLVEFLDDWSRT